MMDLDVKELAERIRKSDYWIEEDCTALCEAAGLIDEWNASDGDTFEQVIFAAAENLGVEVI